MESKKRSILKAVSWRVVATCTTFCLVLLFTGRMDFALGVGVVDTIIKIFAYFLHERMWNKVKYGLDKDPEYQI